MKYTFRYATKDNELNNIKQKNLATQTTDLEEGYIIFKHSLKGPTINPTRYGKSELESTSYSYKIDSKYKSLVDKINVNIYENGELDVWISDITRVI